MNSDLRRLIPFLAITFSLCSLAVAQERPQVTDQTGTWSDLGATLLVIPESRKVIVAYSVPKGTWAHLELDSPLDEEVEWVAAGGALVAFPTKDSVYAFSSATATWGRLKVSLDNKAGITVARDKVTVRDGNTLYVFGINDGAWSGISLESGEAIRLRK